MRLRSQWFKNAQPKTPEERAGAVAFIAWKIAQGALKNTRRSNFQLEVGAQYLAFMEEFLIFLIQVADRLVYAQTHWNVRVTFVTILAHRIADNVADNRCTLLGADPVAVKADFIRQVNEKAEGYAEFEFDAQGENFGFIRYLGSCIQTLMTGSDQLWILDHIMQTEAPQAIRSLQTSIKNLFDDTPRQRRVRGLLTGPE